MSLRNRVVGMVLSAGTTIAATAAQPAATYTMSAAGEIQIAADGLVSDYRLNSQLSPAVAAAVDRAVRGWTFEPVIIDGKAVAAKTSLHVGLRAEPIAGKDDYALRLIDVSFGAPKRLSGVKPPRYPKELVRAHAGGKAILALKIDETGNVVDALPYQSGLDRDAYPQGDALRYTRALEQAALDAARQWHFNPGEEINGKPIGSRVLMPIEFSLCAMPCARPPEGQWHRYFLGPIQPVPWLHEGRVADNRGLADLRDGESLSLDSRFKLRNDVVGKTL